MCVITGMNRGSGSYDPPRRSWDAAPEGWGIPDAYQLSTKRKNRYRGAAAWQTMPDEKTNMGTLAQDLIQYANDNTALFAIIRLHIDRTHLSDPITGYLDGERDPMNTAQRIRYKHKSQQDLVRRLYAHSADHAARFFAVWLGAMIGLLMGNLHAMYDVQLQRKNVMMRFLDPAIKQAAEAGFNNAEINAMLIHVIPSTQGQKAAVADWDAGGAEVKAIKAAVAAIWPAVPVGMRDAVRALFIAMRRTDDRFINARFNVAWDTLAAARVAVMVQAHTMPSSNMTVEDLEDWRADMERALTGYDAAIDTATGVIH